MKRLKENKTMQDDLVRCVGLIAVGLPLFGKFTALEQWERAFRMAGFLLIGVWLVLSVWLGVQDSHMTPEEKRDAERESRDERSQMLQNMARQYSWTLENILIITAGVIFALRDQMTLYSVAYFILVARNLATIAIRWWLERKY